VTKTKGFYIAVLSTLVILAAAAWYVYSSNSTTSELDERWASNDPSNAETVDHESWQALLDDYLVTDTDSGVNLFDYGGLLDDDRQPLDDYVDMLVEQNPLTLNPVEQKAYWINLYNAATVQLILDNYPLRTITKLGESVTDYFAVNCASIGCPNLAAEAFTASDLDEQLDAVSEEYLAHPRGLELEGETLKLSTLFEWYASDFGSNQSEVLATLGKHTSEDITQALANFKGSPNYEYDWSLNGYCSIDDECGEY